jgi:hypothetical protein
MGCEIIAQDIPPVDFVDRVKARRAPRGRCVGGDAWAFSTTQNWTRTMTNKTLELQPNSAGSATGSTVKLASDQIIGSPDMTTQAQGSAPAPEPVAAAPIRSRIRTLRLPAPFGYSNIFELIDKLGAEILPDVWGLYPAWELQPYRYLSKLKGYCTSKLVNNGSNIVLRNTRIKSTITKSEFGKCLKEFKLVRDALRLAFERETIKVAFMDGFGHMVPNVPKEIFAARHHEIFYTGFVCFVFNGKKLRLRVLGDTADFESYIRGAPDSKKSGSPPQLPVPLIRSIARAFDEREPRYRVTKEKVFDLLHPTLIKAGFTLTRRNFDLKVWPEIVAGDKRGLDNSTKEDKAQFEKDKARLEARVLEAYQKWKRSISGSITAA